MFVAVGMTNGKKVKYFEHHQFALLHFSSHYTAPLYNYLHYVTLVRRFCWVVVCMETLAISPSV